jgi:hypothetical protein
MKKIALTTVLFCIGLMFCNTSNAQCKFKKITKYTKFAVSEDCSVDVDYATKPKALFDKYFTGAAVSFVKSGDDYYLFLFQSRSYSSKYEIRENNSMDIIFDDGEPLKLYPCGNFSGKRPGISAVVYQIGCFYKIDKSQIQHIADNVVQMVLIHISSEKEISNTQIDEDGSMFLEYIIHSDSYDDNAPKAAACILTK